MTTFKHMFDLAFSLCGNEYEFTAAGDFWH